MKFDIVERQEFKSAGVGGIGAVIAAFGKKYIPQFLGKFTSLVVGVALILAGAFIKASVVGELLIGAGVYLAATGAYDAFNGQASGVSYSIGGASTSMYAPMSLSL